MQRNACIRFHNDFELFHEKFLAQPAKIPDTCVIEDLNSEGTFGREKLKSRNTMGKPRRVQVSGGLLDKDKESVVILVKLSACNHSGKTDQL